MVKRSSIANIVALSMALAGGCGALFANVHFVKKPDTMLDWAVQICGGMTFAIIIYFIVWGHFQERDRAE